MEPWSPPKNPKDAPQYGLTFATAFSTSFLEISFSARGPHWYLNSWGSVKGMGKISKYLQEGWVVTPPSRFWGAQGGVQRSPSPTRVPSRLWGVGAAGFALWCGINSPAEAGAEAALGTPGGMGDPPLHPKPCTPNPTMTPPTHFCLTNSSVTSFRTSPNTWCCFLRMGVSEGGHRAAPSPPKIPACPPHILPWVHLEQMQELPQST